MQLKQALYKQCVNVVEERLQTIEAIISSNQKALESETKSSVGDKHETGRAMLQLEMEKAGQQLATIIQMKQVLAKINTDKTTQVACLGSVIYTDNINYFLAISCGKLTVNKEAFFAVSISSPIGKLLLGKQKETTFTFNNSVIKVLNVL